MKAEVLDRSGFYGPTVQAEHDWHVECQRNPLAVQELMLKWGMPQ